MVKILAACAGLSNKTRLNGTPKVGKIDKRQKELLSLDVYALTKLNGAVLVDDNHLTFQSVNGGHSKQ